MVGELERRRREERALCFPSSKAWLWGHLHGQASGAKSRSKNSCNENHAKCGKLSRFPGAAQDPVPGADPARYRPLLFQKAKPWAEPPSPGLWFAR